MSTKTKRPKPVWVNLGGGRSKLAVGGLAEAIRKLPRHNNKSLLTVSVHPRQAKIFARLAHEAGFKNIRFDKNGRCYSDGGEREEQEYVYYRTGLIKTDAAYTFLSDRRERELRPEDFPR